MLKASNAQPTKRMRWTPRLVKQLRGKRTLADFGALIGAPKNTVWRWEAGHAQPDATYSERLSELAERDHFLKNWTLAGSMLLKIGRISLQESYGDWAEHLVAQPGFDIAPFTVEVTSEAFNHPFDDPF